MILDFPDSSDAHGSSPASMISCMGKYTRTAAMFHQNCPCGCG
ncbi:hypothetical protein NSU_1979 [Novosphingobium pentaromativorans US6-1]|uniref:Uncharacterized protein n=1 Tax=Novosphingobium pentaromativorans US6-1 TaxID=1088721 RepID=G6ECA9_9SPHN|nr:hypothetical protein NSU_1979 [Novosphingobium pentaromativorans US6-1]